MLVMLVSIGPANWMVATDEADSAVLMYLPSDIFIEAFEGVISARDETRLLQSQTHQIISKR